MRIFVAPALVGAQSSTEWWVLRRGEVVHREADREAAQTKAIALASVHTNAGTPAEVWLSGRTADVRLWPTSPP